MPDTPEARWDRKDVLTVKHHPGQITMRQCGSGSQPQRPEYQPRPDRCPAVAAPVRRVRCSDRECPALTPVPTDPPPPATPARHCRHRPEQRCLPALPANRDGLSVRPPDHDPAVSQSAYPPPSHPVLPPLAEPAPVAPQRPVRRRADPQRRCPDGG